MPQGVDEKMVRRHKCRERLHIVTIDGRHELVERFGGSRTVSWIRHVLYPRTTCFCNGAMLLPSSIKLSPVVIRAVALWHVDPLLPPSCLLCTTLFSSDAKNGGKRRSLICGTETISR